MPSLIAFFEKFMSYMHSGLGPWYFLLPFTDNGAKQAKQAICGRWGKELYWEKKATGTLKRQSRSLHSLTLWRLPNAQKHVLNII